MAYVNSLYLFMCIETILDICMQSATVGYTGAVGSSGATVFKTVNGAFFF